MKHMMSYIAMIALSAFLTSCMGSDDNITQDTIDGDTSYGGFTGVESAQTISSTKVTLSWSKSPDKEVIGYNIYNSTIRTAPILIKTVDKNTTQTTISGLNEGFLYKFRVKATKEDGEEDANSNDLAAIPFGGVEGVTVESSTSARLSIKPLPQAEALQSNVYCKTPDTDWELMSNVTNMSQTTVLLEGLTQNVPYTCRHNLKISDTEDNNMERITFTPLGRADRIVFIEDFGGTQPGNGASNQPLTVQPVVVVLDENNNIVSGGPDSTALISLTVSVDSPTSGTVRGTTQVNAENGVATFTDLFMQESGGKILTATKEDTSSFSFGTPQMTTDSETFNITPGNVSATLSSISISPASTTLVANGSDTYQVTFALKDQFGNPAEGIVPEFSSNILGDFLSQPTNPTDQNGETTGAITTTIADTNQQSVTRTLRISSPAGLEAITVNAPFQPGPASKLAFTVQPLNSPAGANGLNDISVTVQDSFNNNIISGSSANSPITMSINNNTGGASLTGTTTVNATNGTAVFTDLGIDRTANGYKLVANSGSLDPAYSNNFNVASGIPRVIAMEGPENVISGGCSEAITLQLRDFGGNPAKAVQNITVQLSGLGNASLYTNTSCSGTAANSMVTFTPGTDTRTFYLSSNKVESLTVSGVDTSSVLESSEYNIFVNPSKLELLAEDENGDPLEIPSGQCSQAFYIKPLAEDGSEGRFYNPKDLTLTGLNGSSATIYSDSSCNNEVDVSSIPAVVAASPNQDTPLYIKGPNSESLLLNVADPEGLMSTVSLPQEINILVSNIIFAGPASVPSLNCSEAFTINFEDENANSASVNKDVNLTINGLENYTTGRFYTSSSCSGTGSAETITVPQGTANMSVYFEGIDSAELDLFLSDDSGLLKNSETIRFSVTPSTLDLLAPVGFSESDSAECIGPFQVETLDGNGNQSSVVSELIVNLGIGGDSSYAYSDSSCEEEISNLTFSAGESEKDFWFNGFYPESNLIISAEDDAGVLISDSMMWTVNPSLGFLGTVSNTTFPYYDLEPFEPNIEVVNSYEDGVTHGNKLAFGPNKQYLYVSTDNDKILKYDYVNEKYIGWTGRRNYNDNSTVKGSNLSNPSTALCASVGVGRMLPGWCVGGESGAGDVHDGGLNNPRGMAIDETYLYVANYSGDTVNRYVAETGEFAGWIGNVHDTDGIEDANDDGTTANDLCPTASEGEVTPVWCIGGHNEGADSNAGHKIDNPRSVAYDDIYLYVGTEDSVKRFNKTTGSFEGWIGEVIDTPTSNASGTVGNCASAVNGDVTPGWCLGGSTRRSDPRDSGYVYRAASLIIRGNDLYIGNRYNGVMNRYNINTGAFIETLPNHNRDWNNAYDMVWDSANNKFLVADDNRVMQVSETGLIEGWIGKVLNNTGMSGPGCGSLGPNDNTPGWCIGGTHKDGLDDGSFIDTQGIAYDGSGYFVTMDHTVPKIRKFDATTGEFIGSWGKRDLSPNQWVNDYTSNAEGEGYSDEAMVRPMGSVVVEDFLFVADSHGSRIKKIDRKTGKLLGWVGGVTTAPKGGETPGCDTANPMGPSPGWCLGALYNPRDRWDQMISDTTQGLMREPYGITSDGIWLYVTDRLLHRVHRYRVDNGSYGGWLGRVGQNAPTGGSGNNCLGALEDSFTDGWCLGGDSKSGRGDGHLNEPRGIVYANGNIYVMDVRNHRVSSYNAVTGQFNGWIGRIGAESPTSGCTPASNGDYMVSSSGWCRGGYAQQGNGESEKGGSFNMIDSDYYSSDIHSDGVHLYITNNRLSRIDKYNFNGEFIEATLTYSDQYSNTWTSDVNDLANLPHRNCGYPTSIWIGSEYIYGLNAQGCERRNDYTQRLWKMNKTTGTIYGWKGGLFSSPTGGEPGCVGATTFTPAWCQGGHTTNYNRLGGYSSHYGMLSVDGAYVYVSDWDANRVVRVPK